MKLEIHLSSIEEKKILNNLMQLYLYDFSQIDGADVDQYGLFTFGYLDQYWIEEERHPFLLRADGHLAGFALLRRGTYFEVQERPQDMAMMMAEFFVMRKYRQRGIGKRVAFKFFDRFPGRWEIAQTSNNTPAQRFWRKVVEEYTGGVYSEHKLDNENWRGPVQVFNNALGEIE